MIYSTTDQNLALSIIDQNLALPITLPPYTLINDQNVVLPGIPEAYKILYPFPENITDQCTDLKCRL